MNFMLGIVPVRKLPSEPFEKSEVIMFQRSEQSYHQTKLTLQRRLESEKTADQLLEVARGAFQRAMVAEGIIMARTEQNRMLRDLLDEMLKEMLKKL
ncbi:MAG: hypothetical protein U0694_29040 [Anaerolineae bacterium]